MPRPQITVDGSRALLDRFAQIRAEHEVPLEFSAEVLAEAERVAAQPLSLPVRDETAVPYCTLDPVGSMDLDQALHIERVGRNYRVRYAIAHVASFIEPGGAIDLEARRRGQTVYCPDMRVPLHPPRLSEGAASLLPGVARPAYVWDMTVDATGEGTDVQVYSALVRSVDRFDYAQVQGLVDGGTDDQRLVLLKEVGLLRIAREATRGGASLPIPSQEVAVAADGTYAVHYRPPVPSEDWNAQISLMTGMAAAELMLGAGVGLLRTMPAAPQAAIDRLRREARALGIRWSSKQSYGEFLRSLDRDNPAHLALIYEAAGLFRGAGYVAFDGSPPAQSEHAAVASTYAHVTAPLRRLGDRFTLAVCAAISGAEPVPLWARAALPELPSALSRSDQLANAVNRACLDATEAAVLSARIGEEFDAVVVGAGDRGLKIQVLDPAVVAAADGRAGEGEQVRARLTQADISTGTVRFTI